MKTNILDLIDFEKVDTLLEGFNKSTGFVTAILDLNGKVLSKSGWRQMCTDFHRINPETSKKCTISDTKLAGKLAEGEKYHYYKCLNGLVDVAVPITINGEHIANLFSGQFFFEEPDRTFFKKQAHKYGFEEEKYLKSLEKVPVVSKEKVKVAMDFLLNMTQLISEMTYQKLQQAELNKSLVQNEKHLNNTQQIAQIGSWRHDLETNEVIWTDELYKMYGFDPAFPPPVLTESLNLFTKESWDLLSTSIAEISITGNPYEIELKTIRKDGSKGWMWSRGEAIKNEKGEIKALWGATQDITERKRAEERQQKLLDRFNRIASNVPGAIYEFCLKPDGTFYIPYASEGFSRIYGITPEDVKTDASPLLQLIHPEDSKTFFNSIEESAKKLTSWHNENRVILPSGEIIWVEGKSTPQKLEDGTILWQGYINNITTRKLNELERQKFVLLAESSTEFIGMCDLEFKPVYVNPAGIRIVGLSDLAAACKAKVEDYFFPEDQQFMMEEFFPRVLRDGNGDVEIRLRHFQTGKPIWMYYYLYSVRDANGTMIGWATVSRDITEQKQAKEVLQQERANLKSVLENTQSGVFFFDENGENCWMNPEALRIHGFSSPSDMLDRFTKYAQEWELCNPTGCVLTLDEWPDSRALRGERFQDYEVQLRHLKTGHTTDVLYSCADVRDINGKIERLVFTILDISERKKAEEELRTSEAKFKSVAEVSPMAIYGSSGSDQKATYINEAFYKIFGYTREDVPTVGDWWIKAFPDEKYRQQVIDQWTYNIEIAEKNNTDVEALECICICKDGAEKEIAWFGKTIGDEFWAYGLDFTERKQAEKALRISERKFEESFRLSPYLVSLTAMDGHVLEVNDMIFDTFGYTKEEFLGNNTTELPIWVYPEQRAASIKQLKETGILHEMEIKYRKKSGEIGDYLVSATVIELNEEKVLLSIIHNISERKEKEKALKESQEKFSALFDKASLPSALTHLPGHELADVNDSWLKLFGFTKAEVIGKTALEIGINQNAKNRKHTIEKIAEKSQVRNLEQNLFNKSGEPITVIMNLNVVEINGKEFAITSLQDITESKKIQKALRESDELLRLSSELANVAAWEMDLLTDTMTRSSNHDNLYGLSDVGQWHVNTFLDATHVDDRERSNAIINKSTSPGGPDEYRFDFRILYPDQSIHWLNVIGVVIERDTEGAGIKIRGFITDITDRKQAEEDLRDAKELLTNAIDNAPAGMCLVKMDGNFSMANKSLCDMFDYTETELKSKTFQEVTHPEDYDIGAKSLEAMKSGKIDRVTFGKRYLKKNGESFHAKIQSSVLKDEAGTPIYFFTHIEDITERREAKIALKLSEEKFAKTFRLSPYMVSLSSMDGTVVEVNDSVFNIVGYTKDEFIGKTTTELQLWANPDDRDIFINHLKKYGSVHEMEVKFRNKSDEIRDYSLSAGIIELQEGKLVLGIVHDITERKIAEEKIKKLNAELEMKVILRTAQLEATNKELETFTYSVSHDLKAPLRGIDGYSKLLFDLYNTSLNDEAQTFIKTIRSSTLQMNQLIDDLLNYSRLERSLLSSEVIKIKDMMKSILSLYNADLEASKFKVNMTIADIEITADPKGLAIALRNLLENAIKFTKNEAEPCIQIHLEESELSWIVSVNDNGIGFDMQYHQKIFDIFQRLQRTEDYAGTGIGLAMVSKAMQRMHGKVWAESTLGEGTTFYLEIPKNN